MPNDILLNQDGTPVIENGDFVIGESTEQHQKLLLISQKGDFRQYPFIGVGIDNFLNDDEISDLGAEIQKEFEKDGMTVNKVRVTDIGKVNIDANY